MTNSEVVTQIGKGGRITLPAKMRKVLQVNTGDAVVLRLERGMVQVIPLHQAVRLAQEKVRSYIPEGISLVDELIQARREEAAHE